MNTLQLEVDRVKRLPSAAARRTHLTKMLARTDNKARLHFNALLVTALREADVQVWSGK